MAPAVCPNGHTSDSTDYCDTCGSPIESGGGAAAAPTPAPAATTSPAKPLGVVCPNCGIMNAPGALFCEACGYDYTTGTMPRPADVSVLDLDAPLSDVTPPAEENPAVGSPTSAAGADAPIAPAPPASSTPGSVLDIDAPGAASAPPPIPTPAYSGPAGAGDAPTTSPPEPEGDTFDWVLELWVDPEWYAVQESPDPMPSAGLPEIVPLRKRSLLIGRPSRSRNIDPDIDCEPDSGISRRQAHLSTDGTRWFIEDLDSANGTFVADAAGGLPDTPLTPGRRHELSGDERIYLGAWTRLVLRKATPEEQEAYAGI